jgi:hypothetical protein
VRTARLLPALLLTLVVTGCSAAATQPQATHPSGPAPSRGSSCRTSETVHVERRDPFVLYARRFQVAPGASARGHADATLYTYPSISPGVYLDAPGAGRLTPALTDALLRRVPQGAPSVDSLRGLAWDVHNRGTTHGRYLAYGAATVYRASWTAHTCRRRLSGSLVVVGRIHEGVARCRPGRATDPLREVARVTACHHDSSEARPFRDPTG